MELTARLQLKEDDTLEFAETKSLNPDTGTIQTYSIRITDGQSIVNGVILPRKIGFAWDSQVTVEVMPVAAENESRRE